MIRDMKWILEQEQIQAKRRYEAQIRAAKEVSRQQVISQHISHFNARMRIDIMRLFFS